MVNSLNRLEAMYTQDEFPYLANAKARVHINIHLLNVLSNSNEGGYYGDPSGQKRW